MTTIRRQSVFSLVFIYAGFLIGALNVLVLFPKYFSPEEFGLTRLMLELALLFSTLCTLGMIPVSIKFFPYHRRYLPDNKNDLGFLTLFVTLLGLTLLMVFLPLLKPLIIRKFGYRSPLFVEYFNLLYPLTIGLTLFSLFEGYAWITGKTIVSNFLKEFLFRFIGTVFIVLWIVGWINGFDVFAGLFSLSYFPPLFFLAFVIWRSRQIPINPGFSPVTRRLKGKMAGFGLAFFASSALNVLARTNDSIILASQSSGGLTDTAVFNVATYLITLMEVPQRSLTSAATAQIAIAWKARNMERLASIYRKTALNLLIIGLALIGLIWLNVDVLVYFLGPAYAPVTGLIVVLGMARIIDMGSGMNSQVLMLSKHWKIDLFSNMVFVALSLILNYALTTRLGVAGPAYGGLIAIVFFNLLRFLAIWKLYGLQPFTWGHLKAIGWAAGLLLIAWLIPIKGPLLLTSSLKSIFFGGSFALIIIWSNISPDLSELAGTIGKRFSKFNN
jgi:O-antigen/teichoic acid export membrane protein